MQWQLPEMFSSFHDDSEFQALITEPIMQRRVEAQNDWNPRSDKPSLFNHWFTTSTYVISEVTKLNKAERAVLSRNPLLFAAWGAIKITDVIGMHYDYFLD